MQAKQVTSQTTSFLEISKVNAWSTSGQQRVVHVHHFPIKSPLGQIAQPAWAQERRLVSRSTLSLAISIYSRRRAGEAVHRNALGHLIRRAPNCLCSQWAVFL